MKARTTVAIAILLASGAVSMNAGASELAWQQPGYVMEELIVTAPRIERDSTPALRARIANRLRALTADSIRLIRGTDELRANIDLFTVSP